MEETSVLIDRSQAGEREAREVLIENNLGLVRSIVRRYRGRGVEEEDLFQIGTIGLMKAIDKFDLSRNLQFSTYAVPMIAGEIKRFLRDDGPVKVSRIIRENEAKIRCCSRKLRVRLGREPTIREICEDTGLSTEEVVEAMEASATVESLYSVSYSEDGSELTLADRVVGGDKGSVGMLSTAVGSLGDPEKEKVLDHMLVAKLLSDLSEEERQLVTLRYFADQTQVQVAKQLGISQVQVSRLEKKILRGMRSRAL